MNSLKQNLKSVNYITLFSFTIFFLFFEQVNISNLSISPYRISMIAMIFILIINTIIKKHFYVKLDFIIFSFFLIVTSVLGLDLKNIPVLQTYIFMCVITIFMYNFIKFGTLNKKYEIELSNLVAIILLLGGLILIFDYFGFTRFYSLLSEGVYHDLLNGRGCSLLGGESNISAARFSALLPLLVYGIFEKKDLSSRLFLLFCLLIAVIALILTGSRMGYITISIIVLATLFKELKEAKAIAKISIMFLTTLLIVILLFSMTLLKNQQDNVERIQSMFNITNLAENNIDDIEDSMLIRLMLFLGGIDMIKNNPIKGVGIGNSRYLSLKYTGENREMRYLHNSYLDLGSENGLPILIYFILFNIIIIKKIFRRFKESSDNFFYYFAIGHIILLFCMFFLSDFVNKLFWGFYLPLSLYLSEKKVVI